MNWKTENNALTREFVLADFRSAVEFVQKIIPLAEAADHHPDILIHSYNRVVVWLTTHSEKKITEKDHALSREIDRIKIGVTKK
jgi:4a-hydroxytetrahydrobiopterin dehydratase